MIGTLPTSGTSLIDHDSSSEYIVQEDLTKAARKVSDAKKHESTSPATALLFDALKYAYFLLSQIGVHCVNCPSAHVSYRTVDLTSTHSRLSCI